MADARRAALVTGASRGIGRAIASALVRAGSRVACVGRDPARLAEAIATFDQPSLAVPVVAELTRSDEVRRMVQSSVRHLDHLDVVVHAAGAGGFVAATRVTAEEWEACRAINLDALIYLTRETVPWLLDRGAGHLILVSSIAAVHAFEGAGPYCAAKAGAKAFADCLRQEIRRSGVRVTTVLAGSVNTPFWDRYDLGLDRARMLVASDVADAVLAALSASEHGSIDEITILPREGIL